MTAPLLRLLGLLLIASAIAIALSRAADRPVETLVSRWALPPSDFVDVGGQIVHLRDIGPRDDPVPIVLLHGLSSSLHTWQGWAQGLARTRRVITFDLPGFGLTGPNDSGRYTTADDARFTLALLDQLRIARAVVGGSSLGGEVAWQLAALAPERVDRLILVSATGPDFRSERVPLGWVLARIPVIRWLGESLLPRALVAEGLVKAYADADKVTPDLVDRHFEIALREGNRRALGQRLAQWTPGADAARMAEVKVPTLVLWGAQDRVVPPAVAREFEQRIAGSRVVLLEGLGHLPHEEDPLRSLAAVREFLDARSAASDRLSADRLSADRLSADRSLLERR